MQEPVDFDDRKDTNRTLRYLISSLILPQVERSGMKSIFVAESAWRSDMDLLPGMTATHKPLRGKRTRIKSDRPYARTALMEAQWSEDSLQSARTPKLYFSIRIPAILQVADYELRCLPGQGILVPAGTPTNSKSPSATSQETLQIMPYRGGLLCWTTRRWLDATQKQCVGEQTCSIPYSKAATYIHELAEEALGNAPHCQTACDSFLKIALILLVREMELLPIMYSGQIKGAPSHRYNPPTYSIQQLQEYLARNLRKPLTIDKAARYMCMSRTMFTAWFRAKTGTAFNQYIQNLRFEAACGLLRDGDLGIHHIAAAVGLKPNRMREIFQKRENVSPQQYRQNSRKESADHGA